jgi:uncharacterized protein YjdB
MLPYITVMLCALPACEPGRPLFDPTADSGEPNASLARIVIEPDQATITSNDSLDVAAFGLTSTGDTVDVDVTWTAVTGSVTGNGKGRGRALGRYKPARLGTDQVVVRASASQLSDTALVTVMEPAAASVTLSLSSAALAVDSTVQLTATVKDAAGNTLAGKAVTWSSSNSSAATVDAAGLVRGVAAGSATISATSDGVSGAAAITVTDTEPSAASVTVSPSSISITVGSTVQLTGTVRDASGNVLSGKTITWSSSSSSVATVDAAGLVRGVAAGSATITATSDGVSGTAAATVTDPSVASVTISPSSTSITVGSTVQLTGTVRDASGNVLSGKTIAWSSSNSSVASVDAAGLVRGVAAGSATITATSDGVSGTSIISITEGGGSTPCDPLPGVLPVFPGAEGYGTTTPAGRCGQVIRVTNLNDAGPGSLREALLTPGPRVVIFEVSGQINLKSYIAVGNEFDATTYGHLSVYGQTAPSPGITIAGGQIAIRSEDVLIQHLRVRYGLAGNSNKRAFIVAGPGKRIVIDHVSVSWSPDDNSLIWSAPSDITWSNSISSESTYGMLVGQGSQRIAIIRNLLAHNHGRAPQVEGGSTTLIANNFTYNSGSPGLAGVFQFGDGHHAGPHLASVLGNRTKEGPTSDGLTKFFIASNVKAGTQIYLGSPDDNFFAGGYHDVSGNAEFVASPPHPLPSRLTVLPSSDLEAYIVANVGARPADRDPVDARIINNVLNGSGKLISTEDEVGGFPPLAQNTRELTFPPNPHGDDDGDGYTNLEEWIHQFSAQVEGRN